MAVDLWEMSCKTGLTIRPLDSAALDIHFARLGEYDVHLLGAFIDEFQHIAVATLYSSSNHMVTSRD